MNVLGIDPGSSNGKPIGIAVVCINSDHVTPLYLPARTLRGEPAERRAIWREEIAKALDLVGVHLVAIEDAYAPNVHSAARLQEIVALAEDLALAQNIPVVKIHPQTAKKAISFWGIRPENKADTVRIINMVCDLALTHLEHDTADAIAVAIAGEAAYREESIAK